jgi:2-oxoglutarate dehydrogenase complex dehydrogenase (E1) component-like enzyme
LGGFLAMKKHWKLKDLINSLEKAYCNKLAIEYGHITN